MRELERVCVFLGSSTGSNPAIAEATVQMGTELARRGIALVYGGGAVGLMGLLADTVMESGGEVIGIIPRNLFSREVAHLEVTELIETEGMHDRKALMYGMSDAFAALPGGLGTLDELAESATWRQIGIQDKPVGVVDVDGYYSSLNAWFDRVVADGLISQQNRDMIHSAPTSAGLLDLFAADANKTTPKWDDK